MEIVTTHKSTDFDALASAIAATLLYPDAVPVIPKSANPNVKAFLSIHKDLFKIYHPREVDLDKVTRLIVVDTNNWARLEGMSRLKKRKDLEIILWDHHIPGDIVPSSGCQESTGAAITLIIRRLREQRKLLTPMQSTLFLAGLYEDTGSMSFTSTTAEDAYAAAYLLERRADLKLINSFLRPAYGESHKNILFEMLKNATRIKVRGFSVSFNTIEIQGHVNNLSVVVHMYREILNVDAAFGIFLDKNRDMCIVISRSSTSELNVGDLMRSLGGGGHPAAGSAMVRSANPKAVQEILVELIRGNQQSSVQLSDIMSFPVITVTPDTTMEEFALILQEKGCTGLPVVEDGEIKGVISGRDFRKLRNDSQLKAPVKAFMSRDVLTISPDRSPVAAVKLMVKHDIGRLPVVENGRMIGIITRSDTMIYFYDLLPD